MPVRLASVIVGRYKDGLQAQNRTVAERIIRFLYLEFIGEN